MMPSAQLQIHPDAHTAARAGAEAFAAEARAAVEVRGRFSVALSGGTAPREMYALLADDERIPWHTRGQREPVRSAMALARLAACLGIAAGATACGRGRSADPPPPRVSAAAPVTPANDSMMPVARDSADRCRWEAPVPMVHPTDEYAFRYWNAESMTRGVPLRCVLRDGGPEVRVVVRGAGAIPTEVDIYFPADARTKLQTLALDNDQHAHEQNDLAVGEDLNDDGWTDLQVETWSGSGGVVHDLFTWNPQRSRFEQDSVFPGGSDIHSLERRGCAGTVHRSGASESDGAEYCWSGGRWHLERRWTADKRPERFQVRTTEEMRDGRVPRVRIDTIPKRPIAAEEHG